jgi:sulfonate transport system ATP-binding protein
MSLAEAPTHAESDRPARQNRTAQAGKIAQSVTLSSVHRTFDTPAGPRPVLAGIDLTINAGEIVAILGTSGCGKSTLLRQISGLDAPNSGETLIDSTAVRGVDPRTAIAFQEPRLLPWCTLAQNVRLGLPRGTPKVVGAARVAHLLGLVGLSASADLRPRQVSGGMAQRAALARALARNPSVLLLDEPFGALDALTRLKMQDLLLTIHTAEPTTVVLVTHDVDEALHLADRIVLLATVDLSDAGNARSVRAVIDVPGSRPRDHADPLLAALRTELLGGLGVPTYSSTPPQNQPSSIRPSIHVSFPASEESS